MRLPAPCLRLGSTEAVELRDIGGFMAVYVGVRVAHSVLSTVGASFVDRDAHLSALVFAAIWVITAAIRERRA